VPKLIHPTGGEGLACLRAMRTVTAGDGAAQRLLMALDTDPDTLAPISPRELAAAVTTPGMAEQLVHALIVGALADGEPDPAAYERLQGFATALGVSPPGLRTLRLLVEQHMLLFRLDFLRRSHIADMVRDTYKHRGGIRAVAEALLGQRGLHEDKELAARFAALGTLPKDSFGYVYYDHCRANGFAFPGERGGFPYAGAYHDMTHVLSGYGITPDGELLLGGFMAGFKQSHPFYVVLLTALLWGAGINVTPLSQPHLTGMLAKDGLADGFIAAIERGSRVNTDLSDNWDFWPLMPLPLEEARRRLGIAA